MNLKRSSGGDAIPKIMAEIKKYGYDEYPISGILTVEKIDREAELINFLKSCKEVVKGHNITITWTHISTDSDNIYFLTRDSHIDQLKSFVIQQSILKFCNLYNLPDIEYLFALPLNYM